MKEALGNNEEASADPFYNFVSDSILPYAKAEPAYIWEISRKYADALETVTQLGKEVDATLATLEKDLNNKVNRRCNCDDANTSKVVEAAQEQLSAIRRLRERGILEKLPWKLNQAARARIDNPSASLSELASMMEPPITKPAMNNRMKKLILLAKETEV